MSVSLAKPTTTPTHADATSVRTSHDECGSRGHVSTPPARS